MRNKERNPAWASYNLFFAYLSLFFFGLCDNIRGPLYPDLLREFELSNTKGAWFFALASLVLILGAGFIPRALALFGSLRTFQAALLLLVISQFFFAWSPSFGGVLVGAAVLGLSIGSLGVIQNVLVLVASPEQALSKRMGGLHANYAFASLVAPAIVALVHSFSFSYRVNFQITGLLGILLLLLTLRIPGFLESEDHRDEKAHWMKPKPGALSFAFLLSSYVLAEILVSTRLAQLARLEWRASVEESSFWVGAFFVGLLSGRLLVTFFRIPFKLSTQVILCLLTAAVSVVAGIVLSPWFFPVAGLSMGPCYPLVMALIKERFPKGIEDVTTLCVVGTGVFVVLMHVAVGPITDELGIRWALFLAPLFCLIAALILAFQKRIH